MPSRLRGLLPSRYLPRRVRRVGRKLLDIGRARSTNRPEASSVKTRRRAAQPKLTEGKKPAPVIPAGSHLVEMLARGEPLPHAVEAEVRQLLATGKRDLATSLAVSFQTRSETQSLGQLAGGLVAAARYFPDLAWFQLRQLPASLWVHHAVEEYVYSGLQKEPRDVLAQLRALVDDQAMDVPARAWLHMLGPVFGFGDHELARQLFAALDSRVNDSDHDDPDLMVQRDWLRPWIEADPDRHGAAAVPEGVISFAVLDYGHPGRSRASANLGDHIQSIASLGHLVRHQRLSYEGPQDLVDLLVQLRARVRPELQSDSVETRLQLIQASRDASMYAEIPPRTWTLAFGWYMHAIFNMGYGFPFHPNLLPIFISFHCNKRDLLTDEAIEYLRRFAPIGCRDWTTVDVLLSVDVPAFFSGCLTTTVSSLFPDAVAAPPDAPLAYVDMPAEAAPRDATTYRHSSDAVRFRSFAANTYQALQLLETYRRQHSGVVTSRLHCYLPVRSLGVPVDFQPGNRSDPRFAGLIDITDAEFDRMRRTIISRLEDTMTAILAGRPPDEVYALWRDINSEDVAAAQRRRAEAGPMPAARSGLVFQLAARDAMDSTEVWREAVQIAVWLPADGEEAAAVLLRSLAESTSRPLQIWLLSRDSSALDLERLRRAAPEARIVVVDTAGLGDDVRTPQGRRPARRDLDLLVLSELLPQLDRVVVLPVDSVVLDDVAELAELDLGGHLLAAARSVGLRLGSGFGVVHGAGNRLKERTVAATELRRQAHARHRFDFDAFDTDVLVVDAAAWRRRRMVETYLPYIEEFGLTLRELLHFEVGPHRATVPDRWHLVPTRSPVVEPALLHWAEKPKPWSVDMAPAQQYWHDVRARVHRPVSQTSSLPQVPAKRRTPEGTEPPAAQREAGQPAPSPIHPVVAEVRRQRLTYLPVGALNDLCEAARRVDEQDTPGVIIEAGCALGGSAIVLAHAKRPDRPLFVHDVFGMIPPPGEQDGEDVHERYQTIVSGRATGMGGKQYYGYQTDLMGKVEANFEAFGLPLHETRIHLVQGLFQDTIVGDEPVALAHIDGDWYDSVRTCLERIGPRLVPGGVMVIDDYFKWSGCRSAVDEFLAEHPDRYRRVKRTRLHIEPV